MHYRKKLYFLINLLLISCFHLSEGVASNPLLDGIAEAPPPTTHQYNADFLPLEMLNQVFKFIPLTDMLTITLISKDWKLIAEEGEFKVFRTFMDTYQECVPLANAKTFDSSCKVLTNLRNAQNTLMQSGRPYDALKAIAQNYVNKCSKNIGKELENHIINLAMLRIYHCTFELGPDELLESPRCILWGEKPYLSILTPTEKLKNSFLYSQLHKHRKREFASELCERDPKYIQLIISVAKEAMHTQNYTLAASLYSTAIAKDPDLPAETYAEAGYTYLHLHDWPKADSLYSKAFEKDSNLHAIHHLFAGTAFAKVNKDKEASDYFQTFINLFVDDPEEVPPPMLDLVEQVLQKTNAEPKYIEWVSKRRTL